MFRRLSRIHTDPVPKIVEFENTLHLSIVDLINTLKAIISLVIDIPYLLFRFYL